jgi:hypothetical protein
MPDTESRIIKFTVSRSLGIISLRGVDNPKEWIEFADARGEIVIPSNRDVDLRVSNEAMSDLSLLSSLEADDLQELSIICSRRIFKDTQLRHIENLTGLKGLALFETETGDVAFSRLSGLNNLRWLDIGDTQITDEGLAFIQGMSELAELALLNTRVSSACLHLFKKLRKLKRLDLMGTKVDDSGFEILAALKSLEDLRIVNTDISFPVFARLQIALPNCQISYYQRDRI